MAVTCHNCFYQTHVFRIKDVVQKFKDFWSVLLDQIVTLQNMPSMIMFYLNLGRRAQTHRVPKLKTWAKSRANTDHKKIFLHLRLV